MHYIKWKTPQGEVISCIEKLKVLNENLQELISLKLPFNQIQNTTEYKDAIEDCILLGASPQDLINFFSKEED